MLENKLSTQETQILAGMCHMLVENNGELYSQLGQDLLAVAANPGVSTGFYVEIGGGDPVRSSNSYLLQQKYGWNGIIVEPNPDFVSLIGLHRAGLCAPIVVQKAIAKENGKAKFLKAGLLGTLDKFIEGDDHSKQRKTNLRKNGLIEVETISPTDFVKDYVLDSQINFMSIDTEGAELEILSNWPFNMCRPLVIAIEHNNRAWKAEMDKLIVAQGYTRILEQLSKFDAWYILKN